MLIRWARASRSESIKQKKKENKLGFPFPEFFDCDEGQRFRLAVKWELIQEVTIMPFKASIGQQQLSVEATISDLLTRPCAMSLPLLLLLLLFSFLPSSQSVSPQKGFLAPIHKDHSTLLYSISAYLQTPLKPAQLHLDLGGAFSWIDCYKSYSSSTYNHVPCDTPLSQSFNSLICGYCYEPPSPICANDTTLLYPENPVTQKFITTYNALTDVLALPTTDGSTPGQLGLIPDFAFSCCQTALLRGLANKVNGLAGFGRSNQSLPVQVSKASSSTRVFALCLSGSRSVPGVVFIGTSGPYIFSSNIDLSKSLIYTPLIFNPKGSSKFTYWLPSYEYYVGLTSIKVNGKSVPFNSSLLTIDPIQGTGGTKISTDTPYTVLQTGIYKAFTNLFVTESAALNLTVTNPVRPFSVCYLAEAISTTRVGPAVPTVDLVMGNGDVFWRIFGWNSMARVTRKGVADMWCLAVVDGGTNPRTPVVIGGHQMEDNLLQFDLERQRLGFSSSVLLRRTTCADFNFTPEQK